MIKRPNILTIAGFDPSGGAGVLADVKTFESHKCNGFALQTANTIQTEDEFISVNWIDHAIVIEQLKTICKRYSIQGVKIGLVPSLPFLLEIIPIIRSLNEKVKIIWDPILSASTGFDFKHDLSELQDVLSLVDWVTPNWVEIKLLSGMKDSLEGAKILGEFTQLYLKGGHNEKSQGKDYLFSQNRVNNFNPKPGKYYEKHGSGCVFSAALISNLMRGYPTQKAVLKSKRYIEHYLKSDSSKLGKHK
ncbi:MAG: hydroxymethylpyrimidine/phosphomethylpyrimidine kinase [Crocinitomix sp.]|jgi:hydroxymethylpyrimidine/phosphomethylpyrimidine kinase